MLPSAGVIGLSCALKLQHLLSQSRSSENTEILLVAKEWPTSIPGAPWKHSVDYASMWAGAHVRPEPASTAQKAREAAWLKQTCQEFKQLLQTEPWVGVTKCHGIEHLEAPGEDYKSQTDESFSTETGLDGYKRIAASELPHGVELGFTYETYCVNAPVYCANLLRKFISQGGKTLKRDLRSEWEAFAIRPAVKLVVNASGIGFGDLKCFPTRGSSPEHTMQSLLINVSGQTVVTDLVDATKTVTRQRKDGSWSFIIPRFFHGGTIVGGTKQPGNWQTEPSTATRERLLHGASDLIPLAVDSDPQKPRDVKVIADVVGRRPTRDGGVRIEVEEKQLTGTDGELRTGHVLHAYGAGGRGYEISWGVANEVQYIAEELLSSLLSTKPRL